MRLPAAQPKKTWFNIIQGQDSVFFSEVSRVALGPIQPPT